MRGYVGVTDNEWYRFLAARPEISEAEVNFWRPGGGREFRALTVGEPFFFGRAAFHKDICLWLSFETAATITESNVYRSWGASAFLVARLRHFCRDACWHSTCCENCHDWNFHPGPCGCW